MAREGGGVDDDEGGPSCPFSKMVRFSSFFFHYIILTSTIDPEPLKTSVRTCFQGLWVSFD